MKVLMLTILTGFRELLHAEILIDDKRASIKSNIIPLRTAEYFSSTLHFIPNN